MLLSNLPFPIRLLIAIVYDVLDIIDAIPGVNDVVEGFGGAFVGYLLTGNLKALALTAIDGFLPPPLDFFPMATAVVIADELGWLD